MWMMGYNDGSEFNSNIQDSFNSRGRILPVMPRTAGPVPTSTNPPCLFHGGDLVALNHHLAVMTEQNKRDLMNTQQVVVSSRWNPTPEQLQALEELYRQGTRTPSAEQIQHITSELRRYGKIEGKNVFYWFQNHKARERQKRRRQLESPSKEKTPNSKNGEKKEFLTGANRTVHEVEQTKYWASPTNSSTLPPERTTVSKAVAEEEVSECKSDGCVHFDDHEDGELLQQHRKNATWQMMNLSCSSSSTSTNTPAIINSSPVSLSTGIPSMSPTMDLIKPPYNLFNIFLEPYTTETLNETREQVQTLQLFPLKSGGNHFCVNNDDKGEENDSALDSSENPNYQFFEFLPIKN